MSASPFRTLLGLDGLRDVSPRAQERGLDRTMLVRSQPESELPAVPCAEGREISAMVEYREIEGFPGYLIGTDGLIWSCREQISEKGHQGFKTITRPDYHLVPINKSHGYSYVSLTNGPSRIHKRVHVMVLTIFSGPRPQGYQSRHHNGIRTDNRLENLSWATPKVNNADKILHGTRQCGESAPSTKLTARQVQEVRALKGVRTSTQVARVYGVSRGCISGIWTGKNWSSLAPN